MTTTTFTDFKTPILAEWLNDVNGATYNGSAIYTPGGTGSVLTTVQNKLREHLSLFDFLTDIQKTLTQTSSVDVTTAINVAISAANVLGGRAARIDVPPGSYTISSTISIPNNIKIVGAGSMVTIFNSSVAGVTFKFDSSSNSGISGVRIGFSSFTGSEVAISLLTSDGVTACLRNVFDDIEIASTLTNGQRGLKLLTSGVGIISEGQFSNFRFIDIDAPIFNSGGEGNKFPGFNISRFAVSAAKPAINCTGFVNYYEGRVAGACFAGAVAYQEGGTRNFADIFSDITVTNGALNITGANNIVRLNRAAGAGIVGTYSATTTLIDGQYIMANRISTQGTTPTSAQFTLSGFGSGATVTAIQGHDQRLAFTINASGTGFAANATCTYLFVEGNWPVTPPMPQVSKTGGNQLSTPVLSSLGGSTGWQITFAGTPVIGESYGFVVSC